MPLIPQDLDVVINGGDEMDTTNAPRVKCLFADGRQTLTVLERRPSNEVKSGVGTLNVPWKVPVAKNVWRLMHKPVYRQ